MIHLNLSERDVGMWCQIRNYLGNRRNVCPFSFGEACE